MAKRKIEFEIEDTIPLVESPEFPGVMVPEKIITDARTLVNTDWHRKIRQGLNGIMPDDFPGADKATVKDYTSLMALQIEAEKKRAEEAIAGAGKSKSKEEIDKLLADERTKHKAELDTALKSEREKLHNESLKTKTLLTIRSYLGNVREDAQDLLDEAINRAVSIDTAGGSVTFRKPGTDEIMLDGASAMTEKSVAAMIQKSRPALFEKQLNGIGGQSGAGLNGGSQVDFVTMSKAELEARAAEIGFGGRK